MDSIESRVAKGADLLDREFPGWWAMIDVETLDIGCISNCVLGQVFGRFMVGCDALGAPAEDGDPNYGPRRLWEVRHGFELTHGEYTSENVAAIEQGITLQWLHEVSKRAA